MKASSRTDFERLLSISINEDQAATLLRSTQNISARFGTHLSSDVINYCRFAAVMQGVGYHTRDIIQIYTQLLWACVNYELNTVTIENVFIATCNMIRKGRITYEDMLQLLERFPRILELLASIMGKDCKTCVEMIHNKQIPIVPIIEDLLRALLEQSLEVINDR